MSNRVDDAVVRAIVSEALRDDPPPRWVALAARPEWRGSDALQVDDRRVEVLPCVSVLAVREALATRESSADTVSVILTDQDERELGEEVLARVWRSRLHSPTGWESAKHLFRVHTLDAALADDRWLVDLLVRVAPSRGYPPPPSGYLSRDEAWRAFLKHGLRVATEAPTLAHLVRWADTEDAAAAVRELADHASQIALALGETLGPAASLVAGMTFAGRGGDVMAGGLAADALWGPVDAGQVPITRARTRLEGWAGQGTLSDTVARAWGDAAVAAMAHVDLRGQDDRSLSWLERANELLEEMEAVDLASGSSVLRMGLEARLSELGREIGEFLDEPSELALDRVESAVARVEEHRSVGKRGPDRVRGQQARMALRLCRWRHRPTSGPRPDLASSSRAFVADGAWVDRARDVLHEGESVFALAEAYRRLIEIVDLDRRARDLAFGAALAEWATVAPTSSESLLPVERVLERVVAPLAQSQPVLLLVLDGLSYPEAQKLGRDLRDLGWRFRSPGGQPLPPVVAAFPTVTVVSRASLLTGSLRQGGQAEESAGFSAHPALVAASGARAPALFHKRDLRASDGLIAPEVRAAVLDPDRRVVGVVVNAIDDHLDKGTQIRRVDGIAAVKPLRPLLDAASEAGRIVVVVSDHGHILEHGSQVRSFKGAGERWRPATTAPDDDEVLLEGPRVVMGEGRIIAPAVETVRYTPMRKLGYHGGATPQEVLCPLMVLFQGGVSVEGWEPIDDRQPTWWTKRHVEVRVPAAAPSPRPVTHVEPSGQTSFFPEEPQAAEEVVDWSAYPWIPELLASPLWSQRRDSGGRASLDDGASARILSVLAQTQGTAPATVLAEALEVPATRVRGKLSALQQVLNVDGYSILKIEPDGTARLDRAMLATQFGLES
ncbi:BREX-2 system phosphatase PglZ [Gemmatimonadota bacterium Y43]|uniref:BREX-2 system phosphatase PglZ n=1 Tax=Gaopeijia maritima TaxID=3119007 RepID=UPI00326D6ED2